MQQISPSQVSAEVPINENFQTLDHQAVYGKRQPATSGLTWGYYGGRWGGFAITDGTLALTASNTNYQVVAVATGVISNSTVITNWNDATNYLRVYKLTTNTTVVTATEDHRAGPRGVHGGSGGGGGGGMTNPMTTAGDLIVGGASGAPARLAKGTDGKVLKMAAGAVGWSSLQSESPYAATTGTANAIVLTTAAIYPATTALTVGAQVRFRATAANTTATTINWDGLGVVNCRTVTNVALPAGYVRTDIDTVATYDGTNFILQRETERGSNVNGTYVRFADGTQVCTMATTSGNLTTATGALFTGGSRGPLTIPSAFSGSPVCTGCTPANEANWVGVLVSSPTVYAQAFRANSVAVDFTLTVLAVGLWY